MSRVLLVLEDYIAEQRRLQAVREAEAKRLEEERALAAKYEGWANVSDMTDFLGWPFNRVKVMMCKQVTRRGIFLWDYDRATHKSTKRLMKGGGTLNVPVEFGLWTDTNAHFLLYRDWDWYWRLSWPVPANQLDDPEKDPKYVRHRWVKYLRAGAIRTGVYIPHPAERDFPKTWGEHYADLDRFDLLGEQRRMTGLYPGYGQEHLYK